LSSVELDLAGSPVVRVNSDLKLNFKNEHQMHTAKHNQDGKIDIKAVNKHLDQIKEEYKNEEGVSSVTSSDIE
jgi:hypothetical protein